MTRSELISLLAEKCTTLKHADVDACVETILDSRASTLIRGDLAEIRGFGSFQLHLRPPRTGRNPKTGESVTIPEKRRPHFKPGKDLRERVNS